MPSKCTVSRKYGTASSILEVITASSPCSIAYKYGCTFDLYNEHIPTEKPLYKSNVHPYLYAIEHGLEAVMTSNIDEAVPFLRETVHFDGLIIYEPTNETINNNIINAIKNGSDMIL